jgi:hypothetical protein
MGQQPDAAQWDAPAWTNVEDRRRPRGAAWPRLGMAAAALGAALFPVLVTADSLTRDDGYDAGRHWISLLSLGPRGAAEQLLLVVVGVLVLGGSLGLARWPGGPGAAARRTSGWMALLGLGLVAAGVFRIDPVPSYPPHSPSVGVTPSGLVHGVAGCVIIVGLAGACWAGRALLGRRARWWPWVSLVAAAVVAGSMAACMALCARRGGSWEAAHAGVLQRTALFVGLVWLAVTLVRVCAAPWPPTRDDPPSSEGGSSPA